MTKRRAVSLPASSTENRAYVDMATSLRARGVSVIHFNTRSGLGARDL